MGKLEKIMAMDAANVDESVGTRNAPGLAVMSRPSWPAPDPAAARLQGVTRSAELGAAHQDAA